MADSAVQQLPLSPALATGRTDIGMGDSSNAAAHQHYSQAAAAAAAANSAVLPAPSASMPVRVPSHAHTGASSSSHTQANGTSAAAAFVLERPQVYGGGRQGAKPYQEDSYFSWCSPTNRVIVGGIFGPLQNTGGQTTRIPVDLEAVTH
jgi:hypothetical protein